MIMADVLYDFIEGVVQKSYKRPVNPPLTVTERIDRIVMNKWLALPIFALLMSIMFLTTFGPFGSFLMDTLDGLIQGQLSPAVEADAAPRRGIRLGHRSDM